MAAAADLAVLLEDAIDMHDRHWKIHWMLNFAQLSSTLNLRAVTGAEVPAADRPGRGLLALHWVGLVLMALFAAAYCVFRLT